MGQIEIVVNELIDRERAALRLLSWRRETEVMPGNIDIEPALFWVLDGSRIRQTLR